MGQKGQNITYLFVSQKGCIPFYIFIIILSCHKGRIIIYSVGPEGPFIIWIIFIISSVEPEGLIDILKLFCWARRAIPYVYSYSSIAIVNIIPLYLFIINIAVISLYYIVYYYYCVLYSNSNYLPKPCYHLFFIVSYL